jgi:uncharacterized Zn finger protein
MPRATAPAHGWWGEQWLRYLANEAGLEPLTYTQAKGAERGEAKLAAARGKVTATVGVGTSGTRTATLKVKPLTDRDWKRVLEVIGGDASTAQRLLSGMPGAELADAFAAAGVDLFPAGPALRCTCRSQRTCRHMRVLAVRGTALFDANPFLWLEVLGRNRTDVLAAVRARLADQAGRPDTAEPDEAAAPISAERFLTTPADPGTIPVRAGATAAPDAVLRLLGPLPLAPEIARTSYLTEWDVMRGGVTYTMSELVTETADAVLARYLQQISQAAADLATGEGAPRFREESLPGKRVPLKERLAEEMAEVLTGRDVPVSLAELHAECPTAAVLPYAEAESALAGALARLPAEFVALAGRYVAVRSAMLAGLTFRHVITFGEWLNGRLAPDADWARVLALAGLTPPYSVQAGSEVCQVLDPADGIPGQHQGKSLFQLWQPEVGDELVLTVADPVGLLLVATLRRRDRRDAADLLDLDREAAAALRWHLAEGRTAYMAESEAVEALLAEGFYRDGRSPDPVWLLPAPAVGNDLYWGGDRTLSANGYGKAYPSAGRPGYGAWQGLQHALSQFGQSLLQEGLSHREVEAARTCVDLWCRHWPADQTAPRNRPGAGVLGAFLWITAPPEAGRLRGMPMETFPRMLGAWFRFLEAQISRPQDAYQEHIALCDLEDAFAYRVRTLPAGRGGRAQLDAWVMEGYRWLGPDLIFRRE